MGKTTEYTLGVGGRHEAEGYKDPYKGNGKAKTASKPESKETTLEDMLLTMCDGDKAKADAMLAIMNDKAEIPKPKAVAKKTAKKATSKKADDGGNGSVNLKDILNEQFLKENKNVAKL